MKKLFLAIPLLIVPVLISLFFVNAGTNSWTQDLTGAPVFNDCLVIHPTNSQIMYAGTNGNGVYLTIDGGSTWIPTNTGLNTTVHALADQCLQTQMYYGQEPLLQVCTDQLTPVQHGLR